MPEIKEARKMSRATFLGDVAYLGCLASKKNGARVVAAEDLS